MSWNETMSGDEKTPAQQPSPPPPPPSREPPPDTDNRRNEGTPLKYR